jgi:hypothetical protein
MAYRLPVPYGTGSEPETLLILIKCAPLAITAIVQGEFT